MSSFARRILLFQPDIRLYCALGETCSILNQEHRARYSHVLPRAKAVEPTVDNPFGVPLVKRTYELVSPEPGNSAFVNEAASEHIPSRKRIVIYVHGHRTRYFRAVAVLDHIMNIIRDGSGAVQPVIVVGFLWPCHSAKVSYGLARSKTNQAGQILRNAILALQNRNNTIEAVIGHSLGARVVLNALCRSVIPLPALRRPVTRVYLLAAAVSQNAFQGEYLLSSLDTVRVLTFHSSNDPVLEAGFGWGELVSTFSVVSHVLNGDGVALGLSGPNLPADAADADKLIAVNVSDFVRSHSIHAYLAAESFQSHLRDALVAEDV
jgi:esterase/lipase superfamily enzyme